MLNKFLMMVYLIKHFRIGKKFVNILNELEPFRISAISVKVGASLNEFFIFWFQAHAYLPS